MDSYLLETDVLIIGGGLSGVAAACTAANRGTRVAVIEPRSYLGEELAATMRMWLSPDEYTACQSFFADSHCAFATVASDERLRTDAHLIQPDVLKIFLEDQLIKCGVELLYQVRPVGWHRVADGMILDVVGKSGSAQILARRIIDASTQGIFLRMFSGAVRRYEGLSTTVRRTLEFIRVDESKLDQTEHLLPAHMAANSRIHLGHHGSGHVLVEYAFDWQVDHGATGRNAMEIHSQFLNRDIAKWLIECHPAFSDARWVGAAEESGVPALWRAACLDSGADEDQIGGAPNLWRYQVTHGIWAASGAADIDDETSSRLGTDVNRLLDIGTRVAEALVETPAISRPTQSTSHLETHLETRDVDVLVIGGGSSGVPAAIAAAEAGSRVLLVDMNPGLGGTGTLGGVDSYWYGRKAGFNRRVAERVAMEHAWMGIPQDQAKWNIQAKMFAWLNLAVSSGVEVLLHTVLAAVERQGHQLTGAVVATRDGLVRVRAQVVIDATGDGDVAVRAGAEYVYGSDRESVTMWYSMIPFPQPGLSKNNWTSMVDVGDARDLTRAVVSARRRWIGHDHSSYIAPRETRHVLGSVRLTLTHQLLMKRWPDTVHVAYSNHDIKGQSTSDWLRMGLIPPNLEVEIPYRALIPNGVDGLLVAGKAFSATHDALPAIRMQADLENLGAICGIAAHMCIARQVTQRALPVSDLQHELVTSGLLPVEVLNRPVDDKPLSSKEMAFWIDQLDDSQNLYDYSDMGFNEVRRDPIPIVTVCTAGPAIIPLLHHELQAEDSPRRLMVARALAWYGDSAATPVLLAEITPQLAADVLPERVAKIRNTQASPDQGAMPDLAYLFHTLAMVRDGRAIEVLNQAVPKLNPTMERLLDNRSGLFHYVDSLCDIAEQLGDPRCVPALLQLHAFDMFNSRVSHQVSQPDYFEERLAYLEIVIARALARCGSGEGVRTLAAYLSDARRPLVRHAHQELMDISGCELPADEAAWLSWIASATEACAIAPKPWRVPRGES